MAGEVSGSHSEALAASVRQPGVRRSGWKPTLTEWLAGSRARGVLSLIVVALIWEFGARALLKNSLFLVPLSAVALEGINQWQTGALQRHLWVSFQEFALGFGLGAAIGLAGGAILASSRLLRDLLDPWISGLYSTPIIALTPLLILLFGIDVLSKIVIIVLLVVFPVLISTTIGLTTVDAHLIEAARSFGVTELQMFTKVRLPGALPVVVAGFRLGVGRALIGVVVGELVGAKAGIGYLITISAQTFDTAGVFLGVLILAISGVLAVESLKAVERALAPWRQTQPGE